MALLFFDVESVPSQKPGAYEKIRASIEPPGNISKPESILKWYVESADSSAMEKYRKQSFDGLFGEIVSIAWAIDGDQVRCFYRDNEWEEASIISSFLNEISTLTDKNGNRSLITKWIGHDVIRFDLRFLWHRCIVLGIKPPIRIPYDAKPWDDIVFDTKIAWTGLGQYSGAGSLDAICTELGIGSKKSNGDVITGATVYDAYLDGRIEDIAQHNKIDVEMTRKLYKRLTFSM